MELALLILIPFAAGAVCLATNSRPCWERINLAAFILVAVLALKIAANVLTTQSAVSAWNGFLRVDALSALVILLTAFVSLVCAIYAIGYFRRDTADSRISHRQLRLYYSLTPIFVCAMLLAPMADNLGVMWVAIESSTLASVLLVTLYNQKTSFEAGWKYIIIGSIGIALALFGTVFTYYAGVGKLEAEASGMNWSVLVSVADKLNPQAMRLAFILVLLGYGTKAGLAPMHTWKPDAYSEAPVPSATLLGASFINCAFYGIVRFDILAEKCLGHDFPSKLLIGFGIASILVAAPFVLVQRNFRRLLAYSSIDHAGIMVAGLGFGGALGALGATLHMLFHGITKPLMFFCSGNIQQQFSTPYLWKVRGVIHRLPWTGGLFLMATLAVTGTPPFSIFQSEFKILSAALAAGHGWMALLFLFGVVTIFAGFLIHISKLTLGAPALTQTRAVECPWKLAAIISVAIPVAVLGFWLPGPLYELIRQIAQIIGGTP